MLASKTNKNHAINTGEHYLCHECNAVMSLVDQVTENGTTYTWYECTRDGCYGQWLEKKNAKMEVA